MNSQPHLGRKPRSVVPLWRFDPYAERPVRSQAELDAEFDALWNLAADDEEL